MLSLCCAAAEEQNHKSYCDGGSKTNGDLLFVLKLPASELKSSVRVYGRETFPFGMDFFFRIGSIRNKGRLVSYKGRRTLFALQLLVLTVQFKRG